MIYPELDEINEKDIEELNKDNTWLKHLRGEMVPVKKAIRPRINPKGGPITYSEKQRRLFNG